MVVDQKVLQKKHILHNVHLVFLSIIPFCSSFHILLCREFSVECLLVTEFC